MARKDWNTVADREFAAMDREWQTEWSDLRNRVQKRPT